MLVITSLVTNTLYAQDLSQFSEYQRNQKLIEIAKNVYKAPRLKNFYREYGSPTITEARTITVSGNDYDRIYNDPNSCAYGGTNNQKFYIVYFPYNKNKERFEQNYAAKVYIWENTGQAYKIELGNTFGFCVRNGRIPDHDKAPTPPKYYPITYSNDVPNRTSLPKTAKVWDIITITLKTVTTETYDGWTTEQGYNFDPDKDLIEGEVISDSSKYPARNIQIRTIQLLVTGPMKVNVSRYTEEYEAPF